MEFILADVNLGTTPVPTPLPGPVSLLGDLLGNVVESGALGGAMVLAHDGACSVVATCALLNLGREAVEWAISVAFGPGRHERDTLARIQVGRGALVSLFGRASGWGRPQTPEGEIRSAFERAREAGAVDASLEVLVRELLSASRNSRGSSKAGAGKGSVVARGTRIDAVLSGLDFRSDDGRGGIASMTGLARTIAEEIERLLADDDLAFTLEQQAALWRFGQALSRRIPAAGSNQEGQTGGLSFRRSASAA